MRSFKPTLKGDAGPEAKIQNGIIRELKAHDWYVKVMIGNAYQFGVPDLYAAHRNFGQRWIEVKNPLSFSFTPAQITEFPRLHAAGVGIWILFSADLTELDKLFKPANWFEVYYRWAHNAPVKGH